MPPLPARTRDYLGPVTDTRPWDSFDTRAGDIVLSTPPKCGTTWSQAILMMLIHGQAVGDRSVWRDSVWLDCAFRDTPGQKALLDAQTHQRCIKSHAPFDSIPYRKDMIYISVYRHPLDMHFSLMKHISNLKVDLIDFVAPPEPGAPFARFISYPATDMGTDDLTLASMLVHYRSFAKFADLPNVHLFHYADLSRDLPGHIRKYAETIGTPVTDTLVDQIAKAASFGSMKQTTRDETTPDSQGAFREPHKFFDSASSQKWLGRLSEDEIATYHARIAELASPEEIAFLENGHGAAA